MSWGSAARTPSAIASATRAVYDGTIVERAVGFDVAQSRAGGLAHGLEGSDLIDHEGRDLCRRRTQVSPSKPEEVWVTGVSADCHAMCNGAGDRRAHDQRVACMEAAGYVRAEVTSVRSSASWSWR